MTRASRTSTPRLIRLSHPMAFAAFLKHIGAPAARHLSRHRLPALCDDPDVFVPLTAAWSFFDGASQAEDSALGWRVGRFVGERNLNAGLLQKFDHSPTLYKALQEFIAMTGSEASHLQLGLSEREDEILFYTHYPDIKGAPGYHVSQAYQIEVYVSLVRHFVGPDWLPAEIGLECPDIPAGVKDRFPGTRIRTNQRVGYIAIPRYALPRSAHCVTNGDPAGSEDVVVRADQFDYAQALRALLEGYLPEGYPSAKFAASLMDTSVRTLSRRLATHKLSYSMLVDQARYNRARELLLNSDMKIMDISHAVGFEDPSHFTRMFRRIGGLSPRRFRAAGRS